jgi:pathogenesis-related protein 1
MNTMRRLLLARHKAQIHRILARITWMLILIGFLCAHLPGSGDYTEASSMSGLAREILNEHNAVRDDLRLPPLQWSEELAAISQKWANTLLKQRRFDLDPNTPFGENLFMISGGSASPAAVVRQWASESHNYDHGSNSCSGICGHYTQLVWRRTRRVGCAVAKGAGREIWVCSYDPPGNVVGQSPY